MSPVREVLDVSTPGRICLFGEHQDYLNLPVVAAAISLRLKISGESKKHENFLIQLPDIDAVEEFSFHAPLLYTTRNGYLRSAAVILKRHGYTFSSGIECTVRSTIPMKAGTSSSSALVVSWVNFLACMSDNRVMLPPMELAKLAFEAEVTEFSEAGGMMDQCTAAFGGVVAIDFLPSLRVEQLAVDLGPFVIGDSGEPKDTQAILSRVKSGVMGTVTQLRLCDPDFSLHHLANEQMTDYQSTLTQEQFTLLEGTIRNRDLTRTARTLLSSDPLDHQKIGELLTEHHSVLREVQKISTPKIDLMLDAALQAGAYGGKINGSGGGGCMFAYAPEHTGSVAEAIERAGGKAYIVHIDKGSRCEFRMESS